jgi:hypothetical protein
MYCPSISKFTQAVVQRQSLPIKDPLLVPLSDITARNASASFLYLLSSNASGPWVHRNENTPPLTSQSLLSLLSVNNVQDPRKRACGVSRPVPTFSRTTAPSNPYSRKSRDIHHVPELSTSSDSSDGAMEVDDGHLKESDLFGLYEAMHVPLPGPRFSDNSGDEPIAEPASPNHVDTTVSQPFRRWMSTLRRRYFERRKGWHTGAPRLSFDLEDGNTDGTIPSNHLHESIRRMSESITSSLGRKTASLTVGNTSIALHSDAG